MLRNTIKSRTAKFELYTVLIVLESCAISIHTSFFPIPVAERFLFSCLPFSLSICFSLFLSPSVSPPLSLQLFFALSIYLFSISLSHSTEWLSPVRSTFPHFSSCFSLASIVLPVLSLSHSASNQCACVFVIMEKKRILLVEWNRHAQRGEAAPFPPIY